MMTQKKGIYIINLFIVLAILNLILLCM